MIMCLWPNYLRNTAYDTDFNIINFIMDIQVSAKMGKEQRNGKIFYIFFIISITARCSASHHKSTHFSVPLQWMQRHKLGMDTAISCSHIVWHCALHWCHNDHDGVSNHQPHGCLLNRLFRRRSKKTSKLRVTGFCVGNSPGPVNSPHKGQLRGKCFHLMTSSWW